MKGVQLKHNSGSNLYNIVIIIQYYIKKGPSKSIKYKRRLSYEYRRKRTIIILTIQWKSIKHIQPY